MGTSGGWEYDLANGYCCGGTLGSLIRDNSNGDLYILSNFHVLSADIVSGGNGRIANVGDPIIHPALIDISCNANSLEIVAILSDWSNPLSPKAGASVIDAAIAYVDDPTMVDVSGSILGIGGIANVTVPAIESLGMSVKKSGRTTGLTNSGVVVIDATINVSYESECAGLPVGTATFTNQIVIDNKGSKFLAGGDSGSLLVENVNKAPRAIGLLYAGSSSYAIANPIDDVLAAFNAEMVGIDPSNGGGGDDGSTTDGGTGNGNGNRGKKPRSDQAQIALSQAANKKAAAFMSRVPKGVGHGIGLDAGGKPYIAILVESMSDAAAAAVPAAIDGFSARLVATDKIVAL